MYSCGGAVVVKQLQLHIAPIASCIDVADESDVSAKTMRYSANRHGVEDALDSDVSTSWLSMMSHNITLTLTFPHKIKVCKRLSSQCIKMTTP